MPSHPIPYYPTLLHPISPHSIPYHTTPCHPEAQVSKGDGRRQRRQGSPRILAPRVHSLISRIGSGCPRRGRSTRGRLRRQCRGVLAHFSRVDGLDQDHRSVFITRFEDTVTASQRFVTAKGAKATGGQRSCRPVFCWGFLGGEIVCLNKTIPENLYFSRGGRSQ